MLALIAAAVCWRIRLVMAVLVCAGLAAGVLLGVACWAHWAADAQALAAAGTKRWVIEVLADETVGSFGANSPARIIGPTGAGSLVTVTWPKGSDVPALGRRVEVLGSVKPPSADQWGRRAHRSGNVGSMRTRQVSDMGWAHTVRGAVGPLRLWAVARVARVSGRGGDLLSGVVLGDRRRLAGTVAEADFRTTGLTHLVAVSGSHLVVVAMVAGWLLTSMGAGRLARSVGITALVGAYVVFSGVQPSAMRAWVMAIAAALAWLGGRRSDGGSTLALAAAVLLAIAPTSAFDLGFRLSVAAVAGLVLFARLGESWLAPALPGPSRKLAEPIALTLAATMSTLPITVATFQMVSLVAPLANLIAGPLVSVALLAGLAGLTVGAACGPLGDVVMRAGGAVGAMAVDAAAWLASWPHAAVPLGFSAVVGGVVCAMLMAILWAAWPRATPVRSRVVVLGLAGAVALLAVGPPVRPGATIEVLDVGQGDAVLIRDAGHSVLVDTGPSPAALRAALARAGVRSLDAVVITHLHADHAGGMSALDGLVPVQEVDFAQGACAKGSSALTQARTLVGADKIRELSAGSRIDVGGLEVEVVAPLAAVGDGSANESSVVLLVRSTGFRAVLTGDAEDCVLDSLVASGVLDDIDVLKVGHHGSVGAVSDATMAVLKPEYSLISVGEGNRFGHPKASTLDELTRGGSRVVRTDSGGDITVRISPEGYSVRAAH